MPLPTKVRISSTLERRPAELAQHHVGRGREVGDGVGSVPSRSIITALTRSGKRKFLFATETHGKKLQDRHADNTNA